MMTTEEAIRNLADTLQEAHSVALRALRELRAQHDVKGVDIDQFKTAKLDRSQWKGCGLCKGAKIIYGSDITAFCGTSEDGTAYIYTDCEQDEMDFDYCPNCGRPITDEAWEELERRINHES